jgi:nucleotide-binding universal stress UspA family protein
MMDHMILVPLDGSELAEQALPIAVNLAKASSARIVLERVFLEQHEPGLGPGDDIYEHWSDAEAYLANVARKLAAEGLSVEKNVRYGTAVEGILTEIDVSHADLVVMCTHGRTGLAQALIGSVAAELLSRSPVPVLLIGPAVVRTTTLGESVA